MNEKRKQQEKELAKIKRSLPQMCEICGAKATDAAHILPRSLFPEHLSNPLNLAALCRKCHSQFDDNASFRHFQNELYNRACKLDKLGADRYFRKNNVENSFF